MLADGDRVLTRRWVWRQAAGTQIQPQTRCVFVNVDALPPITDATLTLALPKPALVGGPGAERAGRLYLGDIGIPAGVYAELGIAVGRLFAAGRILRLEPAP